MLAQFLIEVATLSLCGGLIGISLVINPMDSLRYEYAVLVDRLGRQGVGNVIWSER